MRNPITSIPPLIVFTASCFILASCKDDEPPAKPKLSFTKTTLEVVESDGIIEVEVSLDKPASQNIEIEYSLSGTAQDYETATQNNPPDYAVTSERYGEIDIEKGATTGIIEITLLSDDYIEDDETIEITINDVNSEEIEITRDDEANITLTQEDGMAILLSWPVPSGASVADMDFLVRIGPNSTTWDGIVTGSIYRSNSIFEEVFIPKAYIGEYFDLGYTNTIFGFTYNYYSGTLDPLNFKVTFGEFTGGQLEPETGFQIFEGSYTASNINTWSTSYPTSIGQTMRLNNGQFTELSSPITIPLSGSRVSGIDKVLSRQLFGMPQFKRPLMPEKYRNILLKK